MSQKIAVAIVHGVGDTAPDFAAGMIQELGARFQSATGEPVDSALAFEPVYWSPVLQGPENELWSRALQGGELDFTSLRRFIVSFAADALAYQPARDEATAYDRIHAVYAASLKKLAATAGPTAPLVVISHSLGTVISSNYFYDHSQPRRRLHGKQTTLALGPKPTPLERCQTLVNLYTLGSPIALWSLRYDGFGTPISVPGAGFAKLWPALANLGGWENYYDPDDIIGYPLRKLNPAYARAVANDRPVNVGNLLTSWNPASHLGYWTDDDVTKPIAAQLAKIWQALK